MADIRFFFAAGACSLGPHILLHEGGLHFTPMPIKRHDTEVEFPPDYHALNPKMRVPVIVVDGEIITEVPAVCTIISQLFPGGKFMGKTPLETVRVYEWLNYLSGTLHATGYGHFFHPWRWTTSDDATIHDGIKHKGEEVIIGCLSYIESRLRQDVVFAVGDELTVVDAFLYAMYRWTKSAEFDMKPYPKYAKLAEELERRHSVKTALEKEGLQGIVSL
ncbi:hypothetical protein BDW62DRAFT_76993 [Aspergillus aurantiobrunneus]